MRTASALLDSPATRASLFALVIVVVTGALYAKVGGYGFVGLDDPTYITENARVREGLTLANVVWAFTSYDASNWHPVTWLSYMLDVELFGVDPAAHHLINLAFHIANSLLLFLLLRKLLADDWQSLFIAMLFAIHPSHVESVAWIAERKDVLSTFFMFGSIWFYLRYVEQRSVAGYSLLLGCFVAGVMAKPMIVTLPCVLLLLDFWPLRRFDVPASPTLRGFVRELKPDLFVEKIPLFAVVLGSCYFTLVAQASAITSGEKYGLAANLANAMLSYSRYIWMTLWPVDIATWYPHPGKLPVWQWGASASFILAVSVAACRLMFSKPYLFVGWFWYIGTLVPVIGLVQIGKQAMAARYTYVPTIGLYVIAVVAVTELTRTMRAGQRLAAGAGVFVIAFLAVVTSTQITHFEGTKALWDRAHEVAGDHYLTSFILARRHYTTGELDLAEGYLRTALEQQPDFIDAVRLLGITLVRQGRSEEAREYLARSLAANPRDFEAAQYLGQGYEESGDLVAAADHYRRAVEMNPEFFHGYFSLGMLAYRQSDLEEALRLFEASCRLDPRHELAAYNAGLVALKLGRVETAKAKLATLEALSSPYHAKLAELLGAFVAE